MITDGPVTAWRCAVCATEVPITTVAPWRCPRSTRTDRHHVLHPVGPTRTAAIDPDRAPASDDQPNPFLRWGPRLAWWAFARSRGMSETSCAELTAEVAGGFAVTPFEVAPALGEAVGAEVWVKDETGNLAGSHKARHLATILLHLRAAEELGLLAHRPPLAIASCGNAALAAATLAQRVEWPIRVFVPDWMDEAFGRELDALGAEIHRCARDRGDPPGDPAMHRFRDAVDAGAIPFSVQGPENALCLDGGRTIGWEMRQPRPGRVFVQVGGGAFAACLGAALGAETRLHAVQVEGCAPLVRAWHRAGSEEHPERRWSEVMVPWSEPASIADGILDDETYDWIGVFDAMRRSGGEPVVVTEDHLRESHGLARAAGYRPSFTGVAGLAGLLSWRESNGDLDSDETVALVLSGIER